jgi:hypothetical protein
MAPNRLRPGIAIRRADAILGKLIQNLHDLATPDYVSTEA